MTLSGIISASQLDTDFGAQRSTLEAAIQRTPSRTVFPLNVFDLTSSVAESLRVLRFLPEDDLEVESIGLYSTATGASTATVTATLSAQSVLATTAVPAGTSLPEFTLSKTISVSGGATTGGGASARTDYQSTTGDRLTLKKGVPYLFTLANDGANAVDAQAWIVAKVKARLS